MILRALTLAWLAGLAAAALGFEPLWAAGVLAAAGIATGLMAARRTREALLLLMLAGVALLSVSRFEAARLPQTPGGVALYNDGAPVRLRGLIVEEPEQRDRSQRLVLRVDEALGADGTWAPAEGKVQVSTRLFPLFAYGDSLELAGKLETPPRFNDFDYRDYLARQGIVSLLAYPEIRRLDSGGGSWLRRGLIELRRPLSLALQRALPEPESSLARGILLGERASIPPELTDQLNRAGISHLIAISGFNVMIVAGASIGALSQILGRRRALPLSMALVLLFALFVGASGSVLRAAVMAEVMLGAMLVGRPGSALNAVLLTGALLTLWRPLIAEDVSFQLSFAATLGIVLVQAPLLERLRLWGRSLPAWSDGFVLEPAAVTLSASVAVMPLMVASFGRVSLVALPANLATVPLFPFVMLTSAATALAGVLWAPLAEIVGLLAYLLLYELVEAGRLAASLPFASLSLGGAAAWVAALLYGVVGALALLLTRRRVELVEAPPRLRPRLALQASALVALLAVLVWWQALDSREGELRLTVLDVGQGDAILLQAPRGQRILIDGGPSVERIDRALGRTLPPDVHDFDLLVLTHAQDDHVTGLVSVLQRYDVQQVLTSPLVGSTAAYRAFRDAAETEDVPLRVAVAGEWADLGGGVRLQVLGPPPGSLRATRDDLNNNSVVLRLVYGSISFLLTGDMAAEEEQALLASYGDLHAAVLKLGHHGSDGSSTTAFLQAVRPDVAVISVGAENTFGHPSPTTLLRLAGVPLLRTDDNGDVSFRSDGRRLWFDLQRGSVRVVDAAAGN